jgi:hypothetical protein
MNQTLKQQKLTLNIIWGAMAWSIIIYWIIYGVIARRQEEAAGPVIEGQSVAVYVMVACATANLLGGWVWHSWRMRQVHNMISPRAFPLLSPDERITLQSQLQGVAIVAMAMFETGAIVGLVIGFLGNPIPYAFHGLALASLLCLGLYRIQGYHEIFGALEKLETRPQQPVS